MTKKDAKTEDLLDDFLQDCELPEVFSGNMGC